MLQRMPHDTAAALSFLTDDSGGAGLGEGAGRADSTHSGRMGSVGSLLSAPLHAALREAETTLAPVAGSSGRPTVSDSRATSESSEGDVPGCESQRGGVGGAGGGGNHGGTISGSDGGDVTPPAARATEDDAPSTAGDASAEEGGSSGADTLDARIGAGVGAGRGAGAHIPAAPGVVTGALSTPPAGSDRGMASLAESVGRMLHEAEEVTFPTPAHVSAPQSSRTRGDAKTRSPGQLVLGYEPRVMRDLFELD